MYMYTCTDNIKASNNNYILRVIFEIKIYIESLYLDFMQYLDALLDHTEFFKESTVYSNSSIFRFRILLFELITKYI